MLLSSDGAVGLGQWAEERVEKYQLSGMNLSECQLLYCCVDAIERMGMEIAEQ